MAMSFALMAWRAASLALMSSTDGFAAAVIFRWAITFSRVSLSYEAYSRVSFTIALRAS